MHENFQFDDWIIEDSTQLLQGLTLSIVISSKDYKDILE